MILMMDFILGVPTVNDRVYTSENFVQAVDKFMSQKNRLITFNEEIPVVNTIKLENVMGTVNDIDVRGNGMVFVDCNFMKTPKSLHIRTFHDLSISPFMIGQMDENTKIVDVESIEYFFVGFKM